MKSVLRNALLNQVGSTKEIDCKICVIDGGALLHKIWWPPKSRVNRSIDIRHLWQENMGNNIKFFVVFDGYTKVTTKNQEQLRRGSSAANVSSTIEIPYVD